MSDYSDKRLPKNVKKRILLKKKMDRKKDRIYFKRFISNEVVMINDLDYDEEVLSFKNISFEFVDVSN